LYLYLVVGLEHKAGGVGGEEDEPDLYLLYLYLMVGLEHKAGRVVGEEERLDCT